MKLVENVINKMAFLTGDCKARDYQRINASN